MSEVYLKPSTRVASTSHIRGLQLHEIKEGTEVQRAYLTERIDSMVFLKSIHPQICQLNLKQGMVKLS